MGTGLERLRPSNSLELRISGRHYSRAEFALYRQQTDAYVEAETQKIWAEETAELMTFTAEIEMAVVDKVVKLADGSAVKQEIAASRLQLMTNLNTRRLSRFGS